jgi:hypothetical protein
MILQFLVVVIALGGLAVCAVPEARAQGLRTLPPAHTVPMASAVDVSTLSAPLPPPGLRGAPVTIESKPFLVPNPDEYRRGKERLHPTPETAPGTIEDPTTRGDGLPGSLVTTQFEGLANSDNAIAGVFARAPDDNLGVGPNHVFQIVNRVGRISNKLGGNASTFTLRSFFSVSQPSESDPRVIFDSQSGRWFAVYLEYSMSLGVSSLRLAVSRSSDPTSFCVYRLGNPITETFLQDYPAIGVSDDKVLLTYNGFTGAGFFFLGAGYYVINKAQLTACAAGVSVVRLPPNSSRYSVHPVHGLTSTSDAFMVMHGGSSLTVFAVSGVPGVTSVSETANAAAIRGWSTPPDAPQLGSDQLLQTNDDRVLSAAWQNNSLVLAGNEACTPSGDIGLRSCLRVIEVRTDTLTVRQDMSFGSAGNYYYFPALRPDRAGNLYVVFTASSLTSFASVRATGRLATDPLDTLQPSVELRAGGGARTEPGGRMGDYSGAAVDPSDPMSVWVMAEYINGSGDWGTSIAQLRLSRSIPDRDFNGDGKSDILWRHSSGALSMWLMNGGSIASTAGLGVVPMAWTISKIADFDGDGKADILWRDTSGNVAIWLMNGGTVAGSGGLGTVATAWTVAGVGDFSGTGKAGILWQDPTSGIVTMWVLGTISSSVSLGVVPPVWTVAGVADFDGDGKADLLWRDTSGNVVIWLMNGGTVAGSVSLGNVPLVWTIAGVGDFNGNGKADIVWRNTTSGAVAVWLMNGGAVTSSLGLGTVPLGWTIAEVGDFDGDGKADLLWRETSSGAVALWLMNGGNVAGNFGLGTVPAVWTPQ